MKDSGERKTYPSGMVREPEDGRPRFDLLLVEGMPYDKQFLTRCAILLSKGAIKYDPRQWEAANTKAELDRYKSSAARHFMQWMTDEDDGEDHAASVFFNLLAAESVKWRIANER
jgi:hypothetical protein